eukprot:GFUD01036005.1.p1 GENE.GFUD01036005.1~~GFUD01036005.1.p1  ORF type:complete len:1046 (+),score=311.60 GFUD01036005.1:157-3294(+)
MITVFTLVNSRWRDTLSGEFPGHFLAMFSWGGASNGELGLGGLEDAHIATPSRVPFTPTAKVVLVAPGGRHSLMLTDKGELYSCGSNDFGQLGRDGGQTRFEAVGGLAQYTVTGAVCGANHSLAVDQWGSVFSWGSDESGQLGHNQGSTTLRVPRLIKSLGTMKVTAVAAGLYHSAALTAGGQLYTWGANAKGQLGLGRDTDMVFSPTLVESLASVPLAGVACGGNHTLVVTRSGAVFAWGSNNHGQLGLGDLTDRMWPTQVSTLRNLRVVPGGVKAGLEHTVALTEEGGVFSWGSSRCGQLGHGNTNKETLPRKVLELMGTTVSQVATGDRHTLAFVPSRGKLYGFGVGGSGQLGRGELNQNSPLPQIVGGLVGEQIGSIAAGGNTSWCCVSPSPSRDMRDQPPALSLLTPALLEQISNYSPEDLMNQDLLEQLEVITSSLSCINGSLLTKDHFCCKASNPGVDLTAWSKAFSIITSSSHSSISSMVLSGMLQAMQKLKESPPDMETLRFYLTFPLHPAFADPVNAKELHFVFAEKCLGLKGAAWKCMEKWIIFSPTSWMDKLITNYKAAALPFLQLKTPTPNETHILQILLLFLRVLSRINSENGYPVSYESFYIPEVGKFHDLSTSYVTWWVDVQKGVDVSSGFYICNYPFMFDPSAKETILKTDQAFSQHQAQKNAVLQMILSGQATIPYLMLIVSRTNIVQETITQLQMANTADLKKPLRVKFEDEEAEDAGGVTKEFFMLLIKEILNPDYGMFKEYDESNMIWFNPNTFEDNSYYFLIGILYGLAIYNFTIINVPFPLILYKKLLNDSLADYSLTDLAQLSPTTAKSLQQLLDYKDKDLEEVFSLTFTISENSFGNVVEVPLKTGGDDIAVTSDNKNEYVKLYIEYVLSKSCEAQFDAFKKGFLKVVSSRVLQLFHPQELMALVVGNENYDWELLEELCEYKEGYTKDHETIVYFWEVFRELSDENKRKFLLFLTGSDRIPIAGMTSLKIAIQMTKDTNFLPVAHTCFNLLDLPDYGTKEKLRYKLLQAIQCTKGFGLV